MSTLSGAEYRRLKRKARDFARSARPGHTYYVIQTVGGADPGQRVMEFQFTKKPIVGLVWGSRSPESMFIRYGGVYDRRNHPDIRNLRTWREHSEHDAKFEARFLGSRGHHQVMSDAARGTAFRSTW